MSNQPKCSNPTCNKKPHPKFAPSLQYFHGQACGETCYRVVMGRLNATVLAFAVARGCKLRPEGHA